MAPDSCCGAGLGGLGRAEGGKQGRIVAMSDLRGRGSPLKAGVRASRREAGPTHKRQSTGVSGA